MPLLGLIWPGSGVLSKAQAQKHRAVIHVAVINARLPEAPLEAFFFWARSER